MRRMLLLFVLLLSPAIASAETLLETMNRIRPEYQTFDRVTAAQFLNRAIWIHKDEGFRLLGKKTGNNCDLPNGELISCDFVVQNVNGVWRGWDVIFQWDTVGRPMHDGPGQDMTQALADGSRTIVDPVSPGSEPGGPGPGPSPDPGGDPDLVARLVALEQSLAHLAARLAAAEADTRALRDHATHLANTLSEQVGLLNAALADLARRVPTGCKAALNLGVRIPVSCTLTW